MDVKNAEVLVRSRTKHSREFLEAWFSKADAINRHIDFQPVYVPIREQSGSHRPSHVSQHLPRRDYSSIDGTNQFAQS